MKRSGAADPEMLHSNAQWALHNGLSERDLVPMLEKLRACAEPGSEAAHFATIELAELLLERAPWRAAALAREVALETDDDRAWAVAGLAHMLLGHYRSAKKAFSRALVLRPTCASYAHNLGHVTDVGLGRPRAALGFLERAHRAAPQEPEIAASYAHALARAGQRRAALELLEQAVTDADPEMTLSRWLASDATHH